MSDTITGTTIADRYRITGYLRAGRMGDVYVARRLEDGRRVSVKLLDPALFYNPEAVKRFARESRIARSIEHPASMRVLDVGRDQIGPYLVMEYVEGEFLSDLLAESGALQPTRAARIVGRIALALEAAHTAGVVHRDLATTNVLLAAQAGNDDIVKVTDFGLSQLSRGGEDDEELTAVGVRIGTPSYMAPEYIQDFELDHRADIYGLGVMLYEMLTGELPFVGRPYAVMEQHVNAERPKPSARMGAIPDWLDELVVQMMHIDPDHRVQSAREVVTLVELGLKESIEAERYVASTAEPTVPRTPAAAHGPRALESLIDGHFVGAERVTDPTPEPTRMFVVARVARTSVAARIGVSPGWRVYLPDEDPGTGLLDPALPAEVAERRYQFYPPGGGEPIGARTTGIDLGMQLLRSPDNVLAYFAPAHPDADALLDLWRQARWAALEEVSLQAITGERDVTALKDANSLATFLGSEGPQRLDRPALVLLGAAQYEQGRRAEGLRWTSLYRDRYTEGDKHVYSAIADLYAGLGDLEAGDRDQAVERLERAARTGWLSRAVARYQELTRGPLDLTPLVGTTPTDMVMGRRTTDSTDISLAKAYSGLGPGELLTICALGGARGNLEYDDLVYRFARFARHLPDRFRTMLVVTSTPERDPDHPEHYRGEEAAIAAGVNLQFVIDERATVHRTLQPGTVPTCYAFDRHGVCVHQGAFTVCDAWDALARAEEGS